MFDNVENIDKDKGDASLLIIYCPRLPANAPLALFGANSNAEL